MGARRPPRPLALPGGAGLREGKSLRAGQRLTLPAAFSGAGFGGDLLAPFPSLREAPRPSCPVEPQQSETESSVSSLFGEKEGTSACPGSGPMSLLSFPAAPTQSSTGVRCRSWLAAACSTTGAAFLEGSGLHADGFGERLGAAPARSARQECVLLHTGSLEPRFLCVPGIAGIFQCLTRNAELGRAAAGRAAGRAAGWAVGRAAGWAAGQAAGQAAGSPGCKPPAWLCRLLLPPPKV